MVLRFSPAWEVGALNPRVVQESAVYTHIFLFSVSKDEKK